MLRVDNIESYYEQAQALFGVTLEIAESEVVTLLGRNGMGKSTTIMSIMGLMDRCDGSIRFRGTEISSLPPYRIARCGIGLVPEGRQIFPNLTVRENLLVAAANHTANPQPYNIDDILTIFPRLNDRLTNFGNQLSGGEQQMLAVGRALMINPRLLILDEATEGLAPLVRQEIWRGLRILKNKGLAILIVDKHLGPLMEIAARHYILEKGTVAWSGTTGELKASPDVRARYLGV